MPAMRDLLWALRVSHRDVHRNPVARLPAVPHAVRQRVLPLWGLRRQPQRARVQGVPPVRG